MEKEKERKVLRVERRTNNGTGVSNESDGLFFSHEMAQAGRAQGREEMGEEKKDGQCSSKLPALRVAVHKDARSDHGHSPSGNLISCSVQ